MIYKRGCDTKGPDKTCSKCGERGACGVYWYKFMWNGKLVRESTKQGNDKVARQMEAAHRTSLAKGEVGIREKKPAPALSEFLKKNFLPYAKTAHSAKPRTAEYYEDGVKMLLKSELAVIPIDQLNGQHAEKFKAEYARLSPSGINCGLRTLRRALNLALEWDQLQRQAKIRLAENEHQRDRVLSTQEAGRYLSDCPQPWRDVATIILDEGFRPSEVFSLRWEHITFQGRGFIRVTDSKSRAGRRTLPMTPRVYQLLGERHAGQGEPREGWVFPSTSQTGHFDANAAKDQHKRALKASGVKRFEPYCLRHTALTWFAERLRDPFAVMKIAGHSTIAMTQRYIHYQPEMVDRAFDRMEEPGAFAADTAQPRTRAADGSHWALLSFASEAKLGTNLGTT
jgi:integrase